MSVDIALVVVQPNDRLKPLFIFKLTIIYYHILLVTFYLPLSLGYHGAILYHSFQLFKL